jgi:hypothetical protein
MHAALAVEGESEGYLSVNDLVVEAIRQEIQRIHHTYNSNIR